MLEFTNENGNVKTKVRQNIRDKVLDKLKSTFQNNTPNAESCISIPVDVDIRTGKTIYAHFTLTINLRDPNIDPYTGKPKPAKIEPEIPKLF